MGKKKTNKKPSSDNVYDVISDITLLIKDNKSDNPSRIKFITTRYILGNKFLIPTRFEISSKGETTKKHKNALAILGNVYRCINKISKSKHNGNEMTRKLCIDIMVDAFKSNPNEFDITFKVIPVRGNKADYKFIYDAFEIEI